MEFNGEEEEKKRGNCKFPRAIFLDSGIEEMNFPSAADSDPFPSTWLAVTWFLAPIDYNWQTAER